MHKCNLLLEKYLRSMNRDVSPQMKFLCQRSYLFRKGINIKHVDVLSKLLVAEKGNAPNPKLVTEFEMAYGIMVKLGHQQLAYEYIATPKASSKEVEYHLDYFFMITKSIFDFVGHLVNQVLGLNFRGKNVDLSRTEFRNEVLKSAHSLGAILNINQSWIDHITTLRTTIEHNKIIPVFHLKGLEPEISSSKMYFSFQALSFTELLTFVGNPRKWEFEEPVEFCKESIEHTKEIVEEAFHVALAKLANGRSAGVKS